MDSMNKKITYLLLLLMLIPVGSFAKEKRTFEIKDGHSYVNGKVTPILSGEMHYPRIPHQYWRHRLRMMRAMGLNTVATYVFWNPAVIRGGCRIYRAWRSAGITRSS